MSSGVWATYLCTSHFRNVLNPRFTDFVQFSSDLYSERGEQNARGQNMRILCNIRKHAHLEVHHACLQAPTKIWPLTEDISPCFNAMECLEVLRRNFMFK